MFAHLSGGVSDTFDSHDAQLRMMNHVGNLIPEEIAMAIRA
jgi:hypothetical protein